MSQRRDIITDKLARDAARREAIRMSSAERIMVGVFEMKNGTYKADNDSRRHLIPGSRVELYANGLRVDV